VCGQCGATLAAAPTIPREPVAAEPGEPLQVPPLPGAVALPAVRFAGFWRRLSACLVDSILLYFPASTLRVILGLPLLRMRDDWSDPRVLEAQCFAIAMAWLYCSLFESSRTRGTLGQQLLGMQVTDVEGRRISFARATGRHWAQWLSVFICGVGYLLNLWTSRRQTLHDLVAGCVVVRTGEPAAGAHAGASTLAETP